MPAPSASPLAAAAPIISELASPGPEVAAKASTCGERDPGLVQRVVEQQRQFAQVLARRRLGHDAAVGAVQVDLRGDLAGEQFAASAQDGDGGFVAGGFDGEDQRVVPME